MVILGWDRGKFTQAPDKLYKEKAVLITGRPYVYNELVHVNVTRSDDLAIVEPIEGLYTDRNESSGVAGPDSRKSLLSMKGPLLRMT